MSFFLLQLSVQITLDLLCLFDHQLRQHVVIWTVPLVRVAFLLHLHRDFLRRLKEWGYGLLLLDLIFELD